MTHEEVLEDFARWLRSWGASERTVAGRLRVLRAGLRVWGDDVTAITPEDLQNWLGNPAYSPWTRVAYYGHVRSLFGWLRDTGRVESDPTRSLRRPKSPRGKPRPLTRAETERALSEASGDLRAWLLLGVYAGLRCHEIAKIRGEDVSEETIYVVGKGNKAAYLPTHPVLWELAQGYPRNGYWFPSVQAKHEHVSLSQIGNKVRWHFRALGIEGSIHRCRHTYGTQLLRAGVNMRVVQELMRHESLATTALYTAVGEDERAAGIRALAL